jgi:aerobic-type carbon monoxide dehydrogenase small subunit (CoxS/CutS family)
MKASMTVNGQKVAYGGPDRMLLVDFLRHELRLTGTHVGCEMGVCGACTVIVDGEPIRSCLTFAAQMDRCTIETVESLAEGESLSELQVLMSKHHGLQCGFCTPGILMTFSALKRQGNLPKDEEGIRALLSGNICRCTGYQGIVDALKEFAQ